MSFKRRALRRITRFENWILERKILLTSIMLLFFLIFLSSGGLFVLTEERRVWAIPVTTRVGTVYRFYWPGNVMLQTPSELIVAAIAYFGALIGLYIVYEGIRRTQQSETAHVMAILGLLLMIVAMIVLYVLLYSKITG